ncbi:hypothetical protein EIP91_005985 [Steccherinum ochraceum]|uniref:Uncharacterized protein n=1 Tax=Steccherinum ochraceum TaxID=92696 RepID=A0A4R0R981_9APHY|nr:hypothetical protein EIP91_005985 [Steccherinum ochraceum]
MPKRKVNDVVDESAPSKKVRVASGTSVQVGPGTSKGVTAPTDASTITLATAATDAKVPGKSDPKGKEKAVDVEGDDVEDEEMDNVEESDHEGQGNSSAGPSTSNTRSTHTVRKLAPPRPYPTVPTSVSATGPRSAHTEGKNYICVTRKTPLGGYLRRCKAVVMKDGYRTLHLDATGAAIPHLMQLAVSLPSILPHPPEDIHTEVLTGTVEAQDEIIPDDEDEDISYRTRGISSLSVVIKIGDGVDEVLKQTKNAAKGRNANRSRARGKPPQQQQKRQGDKKAEKQQNKPDGPERIVIREQDMDDG